MKVSELRALEPELEAYELKPDGHYLVCVNRAFTPDKREFITKSLRSAMESHGIKLVAVLDFVPKVFEMEPEK